MRLPSLDERLHAAAELFTACDLGADIGADHGRLSCYLLANQICKRLIVSDISADSLSKARRLLTLHGLEQQAQFRVADGLDALEHPVQCLAICGMGGRLMREILERGKEKLGEADLVLSCHTEIPLLRKALCDIGYHIDAERLVRANGRFYVVMRAVSGKRQYTEKEVYLGPLLMAEKPPLWLPYLRWREGVVACEQGHGAQLDWIKEELRNAESDCKNGI